MEAPSVIASDLDGTLLRSDGTVSAHTRAVLAEVEASGRRVVLVTARPPRWMPAVADATGHRGVAVCANGAVVYDLHTGEVVEATPIPTDLLADAVARLRAALPGARFAVERTDGPGREQAYVSDWPAPPDTHCGPIEDLIRRGQVVKLLVRVPGARSDDVVRAARDVLPWAEALSHSSSRGGLLEVAAPGVDKAATLARLCRRHGVAADAVLAFGDMPNDLPMLRWAGRAVAVANAHPDVKAAADDLTASNDDDGVARYLVRRLGLQAGGAAQREGRTG